MEGCERSGRPKEATTDENIELHSLIMHEKRRCCVIKLDK